MTPDRRGEARPPMGNSCDGRAFELARVGGSRAQRGHAQRPATPGSHRSVRQTGVDMVGAARGRHVRRGAAGLRQRLRPRRGHSCRLARGGRHLAPLSEVTAGPDVDGMWGRWRHRSPGPACAADSPEISGVVPALSRRPVANYSNRDVDLTAWIHLSLDEEYTNTDAISVTSRPIAVPTPIRTTSRRPTGCPTRRPPTLTTTSSPGSPAPR